MCTKPCLGCFLVLPIHHFGKQSSSADGLRSYCKSCISRKNKVNYERNRSPDSKRYDKSKVPVPPEPVVQLPFYLPYSYIPPQEPRPEPRNRFHPKDQCPFPGCDKLKRAESRVCNTHNGLTRWYPTVSLEDLARFAETSVSERAKSNREWAKKVRLDNNFTCSVCGIYSKRHSVAVRRLSRYTNPELAFDVDNGYILCKDCLTNLRQS